MGKYGDLKVLTKEEAIIMERIRNTIPSPTTDTVMVRVIDPTQVDKWFLEGAGKRGISGFFTTTDSVHGLKTPADYFDAFRLDYSGTVFGRNDEYIYILHVKTRDVGKLQTPFGKNMPNPVKGPFLDYLYPYSGNGFAAALNGTWIAEFHAEGIRIEHGSVMVRIDRHGNETIMGIYNVRRDAFDSQ